MTNKRTIIISTLVLAIVAVAGVMLVSAQGDPFEQLLRNQIIQNQEQADAIAAKLQRSD